MEKWENIVDGQEKGKQVNGQLEGKLIVVNRGVKTGEHENGKELLMVY